MKKWALWLLVGILVLSLCACGVPASPASSSDASAPAPQEPGTPPSAAGDEPSAPTLPSGALPQADVKQQVLAHAGVAESAISRYAVEYDVEDGVPHYEIEFYVGNVEYEYEVHAVSGQLLKAEKDDVSLLPAAQDMISAEQAKAAALAHAKLDANAVSRLKAELDADDAVPHYEVEFVAGGYEYDYEIHAKTGAVLNSEKERAD